MRNKILVSAMLLAACIVSTHVSAQLEVTTPGDVTMSKNLDVNKSAVIGQNLTVNNHVNIVKRLSVGKDVTMSEDLSVGGNMSLGTAGIDNHIGLNLYKTTSPTTTPYYGIKTYMNMYSGMPTSPLYGIHSTVDASACIGMCQYPLIGVYGYAMKSYNYPSVFAAGIAGVAHVYGGIAVYGGTNYGATLPSTMPSGCYAGYFNGTVNVNGTLYATNISIPSSLGQTENTRGINSDLADNIHLLNPVAYTIRQDSAWMDDKDAKELRGVHYGLIAEDVQKVLPDIVYERNSELYINYIELIPLLIKEIQELSEELKALKQAVKK